MWNRRLFLSRSTLALLGAAGTCLGVPGEADAPKDENALPDGAASKGMITPRTDQAIERGLQYLANNRHRDGSFGTNAHSGNTAVTSLAAMAFMAGGHQPNRGPYGKHVLDALRFVLSQENRDGLHPGFLHNPAATPHGPMYGHGFATLFLAEVSGMVHDKALRQEVNTKLHRAVQLILDSQNIEGGWRYTPGSKEADLSVTICQIMALRAARNAGISVPKSKVDRCTEYVKRCQDKRGGWFRYMLQGGGGGGHQSFARTAAGVAALNSAGYYLNTDVNKYERDDERRKAREAVQGIEAGLRYLNQHRPGQNAVPRPEWMPKPDMHYFYGHYYAVQVMWTAGGDHWAQWFPAIREELLGSQRRDGSWQDQICAHYATAMACLILQVPNNYLTIFQK
jgi:hypothetical protein